LKVPLNATSTELLVHAIRRLPAIRVDGRWLEGERAVEQAAALLRSGGADLAPAS
jgi:hypothetical protein